MKNAKEKNNTGEGNRKFGESGRIVPILEKELTIKYLSKILRSTRK